MFKGITRRWVLNSLSVTVILLVLFVFGVSFMVRSYVYNDVKTSVYDDCNRAVEAFSSFQTQEDENIEAALSRYIKTYVGDNMMIATEDGRVIYNSTGFESDSFQAMPDFDRAIASNDGSGFWVGTLNSGDKVMAHTRVIYTESGDFSIAFRFVVSLADSDNKILRAILMLIAASLVIVASFAVPVLIFLRTIVAPVGELNATARRIAHGDFETKLEKRYDDEIGELAESINYMSEELKASDRMKNDFISSVSHELRTPLTAIKGWAETMASMSEPDPIMMSKGFGVIVNETERLTGMVEELLDFSRIQNGRMVLVMDKIDLLAELDDAVYMLKERAASEKKHLIYDEPGTVSQVLGDRNRLRQVFINIIDNALKYTPQDGVIGIQVKEDADMLHIIISDTGCGISQKDLPRVKEKFYKANQTVRGSGIGLAVVDEILRLHKGKLDIQSEEGVGTTVTISVPLLDSDDVELLNN